MARPVVALVFLIYITASPLSNIASTRPRYVFLGSAAEPPSPHLPFNGLEAESTTPSSTGH